MSIRFTPSFLRRLLFVDAASSALMALLLLGASDPLQSLLGLPVSLLDAAGMVLLPFALFVGLLSSQAMLWRAGVWVVIVCNALWVIDSLAVLLLGATRPTAAGTAFVLAQAAFVGLLAELQFMALRRAPQAMA